MSTGTKCEIGLMTTARLGAMVAAGEAASDGTTDDNTCGCCKLADASQHILLECTGTKQEISAMLTTLIQVWNEGQNEEFEQADQHRRKMLLLGAKFKNRLSRVQEMATDLTVKKAMVQIDDIRTSRHGLAPMNGNFYTRPPEETLEMADRWEATRQEEEKLREAGSPEAEA
jgi:hypothetical protein